MLHLVIEIDAETNDMQQLRFHTVAILILITEMPSQSLVYINL